MDLKIKDLFASKTQFTFMMFIKYANAAQISDEVSPPIFIYF